MKNSICRKCNNPSTVLIRKEYSYCDDCFITNTNHKFRACIGKNKILTSNERVLICLSGGKSSTVLLDLVQNGISLDNHKKLRIIPFFLHITGIKNEKDSSSTTNKIIKQCRIYNFDLYVTNIKEYHSLNDIQYSINSYSTIEPDCTEFNFFTTTGQDVLTKIKHNLYVRIAKKLDCKIVLTAETTTVLAMRLLSNLVIGRGSQVEDDIGFSDCRDLNVKILRPMRDISNEEIDIYIKIKQLIFNSNPINEEISLQSVIRDFVLDLQDNYSSTISTVCKTADKLGSNNQNDKERKCQLCQSTITTKDSKLTAVEATIFSRKVSNNQITESNLEDNLQSNVTDDSVFPFIFDRLCYCCSRNYSESKRTDLSTFLINNAEK